MKKFTLLLIYIISVLNLSRGAAQTCHYHSSEESCYKVLDRLEKITDSDDETRVFYSHCYWKADSNDNQNCFSCATCENGECSCNSPCRRGILGCYRQSTSPPTEPTSPTGSETSPATTSEPVLETTPPPVVTSPSSTKPPTVEAVGTEDTKDTFPVFETVGAMTGGIVLSALIVGLAYSRRTEYKERLGENEEDLFAAIALEDDAFEALSPHELKKKFGRLPPPAPAQRV